MASFKNRVLGGSQTYYYLQTLLTGDNETRRKPVQNLTRNRYSEFYKISEMKQLLTLIFVFFFFIYGHSQNQFDPKIILLLPQKINTEKGIDRKIESYERNDLNYQRSYHIEKKDSLIESYESNDSIPYNFKVHIVNQIESAKYLTFENKIIFDYASTLQSVLAVELKNVIVLIDTIESFTDNKNLMKAYAEHSKADYIVNTPYLEIKKHKRGILIKPELTVYYKLENEIYDISPFDSDIFNKSYIEIDALVKVMNFIERNGDKESREKLYKQKLLSKPSNQNSRQLIYYREKE